VTFRGGPSSLIPTSTALTAVYTGGVGMGFDILKLTESALLGVIGAAIVFYFVGYLVPLALLPSIADLCD
jgi:hypothetical protein